MEAKMEELKAYEAEVEGHPDKQVSLTDPDARSMMKADGGSTVGYNVQTAVDRLLCSRNERTASEYAALASTIAQCP